MLTTGYKLKGDDLVAGCYLSEIYSWGAIGKQTCWFRPSNTASPGEYCTKRLYFTELFQELIKK